MFRVVPRVELALLTVALSAAAPPAPAMSAVEDPAWLGCWQTEDGDQALWFEAGRCGWLRDGEPRFFRVNYAAERALLESWGRTTELGLRLEEGALRVDGPEGELRLTRVQSVPRALRVEPYELPEVEVDGDTVATIVEDLRARRIEDQRVRVGAPQDAAADPSEMMRVDEDNTEFLVGLIQELGWIDATRFGREASDAAFLLVQHSSDLRLMRTALPLIQADVEAGRLNGQAFALLHDRLQLRLGDRQRFGSQIGVTPDGVSVLMPCEDPENVDERRAALGMGPLAEYLALFEDEDGPVRPLGDVLGSD